jgi:hypothetical protein
MSLISAFARAGEFAVGERVEARLGGKELFYSGVVVTDNQNGSYEICYDDGDVEKVFSSLSSS